MANFKKWWLSLILLIGLSVPVTVIRAAVDAATRQSARNPNHAVADDPLLLTPTPSLTPTPTLISTTAPTVTQTPNALYLPVVIRQGINTLRNGDFEQGTAHWTEFSSRAYRLIVHNDQLTETEPHNGTWAAWLGGLNGEISKLSQETRVPAGEPFLRYWYLISSDPMCGNDVASVLIDDRTIVDQFSLCEVNTKNWHVRTLDLSRYTGQTITLTFRVDTDRDDHPSNLYLDDVEWISPALAAVPITAADATHNGHATARRMDNLLYTALHQNRRITSHRLLLVDRLSTMYTF
ncbi:MAG: hypothetical protein R2932_15300 [Caldilineaceae bacterium]